MSERNSDRGPSERKSINAVRERNSPSQGDPDRQAEEAAAVVVVLTLLAGHGPEAAEPAEPSAWGDPAHRLRLTPAPSTRAWWASGLPR